jgi:preprotein translocase subunit Sss1
MNRRQKIFIAVLLIVLGGLLISGAISDLADYRQPVLIGGLWCNIPQPDLSQLSKDIRNYIGIILIGVAGYIILGKKK